MAYTEGTCTDQFDLLGKIRIFLSDNGWTINLYATDTLTYYTYSQEKSSSAKRLHAAKNGLYLNFRSHQGTMPSEAFPGSFHTGIAYNVSTGFNQSSNWDKQPGSPTLSINGLAVAAMLSFSSAASYRMFLWDSPFTLFVYLKISNTTFAQMYFGTVSPKYGGWSGGDLFLSSTRQATANYAGSFLNPSPGYYIGSLNITDAGIVPSGNPWPTSGEGTDNVIFPSLCVGTTSSADTANTSMLGPLLAAMPSAFAAPMTLLPIQPAIRRAGTSRVSLLGELPYMKLTTCAIADMETVVSYGGSNYIILPVCIPTAGNVNPCVAVLYEGS
jgi:hypothetical protein